MDERKPARRAIVKKRTGPLFSEDLLNELNTKSQTQQPIPTTGHSRRLPSVKEKKDKKRERWLLTRKTWKYMADAGRKLIPEGTQNRPEDIHKVEKHFHNICANEPRFILWRRKASYPGAMGVTRNSKRRLKLLLSHSHKAINVDEETEESRNADQIIDLLQNYLKLDESRKITTLLGSKTVRPDQTSSPSAQRPGGKGRGISSQSMTMSSRGPGFLPPLAQPQKGINALSEIDQLLERLRTLSRSASCRTIIPIQRITPEILEDKALLKQIYNELKKQQLHRILGKHSANTNTSSSSQRASLPHATSLSSLWHFKRDNSVKDLFSGKQTAPSYSGFKSPTTICASSPPLSPSYDTNRRIPPSTLELSAPLTSTLQLQNPLIPVISIKKPSMEVVYSNAGTQTNFIQLPEIERLAKDYKEMKQEEAAALAIGSGGNPTDDESDKGATAGHGHRRKSSIDNEDVSQSVSDTIKRYLRMARKKSVHDDNANRFKRVNYDRNLRNIRAKGEINPPGMDEGNSKATQTLDAWPVIYLNYIRGNENTSVLEEAHLEWRKNLDQRIQQKKEYDEKIQQQQRDAIAKSQNPTHSSSSAPTSPTNTLQSQGHSHASSAPTTASGILHSSTQFLSNLWHGSGHHQHGGQENNPNYHPLPGSNTNSTSSIMSAGTTASGHSYNPKNDSAAMQKSKSSSNVGQFVSKKIWKTRSKSQTRTSSPTKAEWTPKGNCTWTSDSGRQVTLTDVHLQNLTEVETKVLQRVAIEKINQLNIGVSVVAPSDAESASKAQKRRPLAKKKAMTTSFFDIGRKEDKGSQIAVFGNTLENCVAYDQKRRTNLTAASDRGSRNSITSLFRGSSSSKVRSCESLPSGGFSLSHSDTGSSNTAVSGIDCDGAKGSGNGNLVKSAVMQMSRSQSDVRRSSQEYDDLQLNNSMIAPPPMIDATEPTERQVPKFVRDCIEHIEKRGLNSVGIFRVSTSKKRVTQMREEFDRSASTTIDPETCPHDVATLLKEFLRDLPEPLLCRHLYKAFVQTQKIRNRRLQLEALSHLVRLLPTAHRDTLYVLLRFLAKVASCCDDVTGPDGTIHLSGNKMDSNNLATVFAPNILRSPLTGDEYSESGEHTRNSMPDVINVIRTMIDHYEELFRVPAELMDEIYAEMIDTFPEQLNYLCERRNTSDNDEIDSGGSNTPLSSPPPTGIMKANSDGIFRRTTPQPQSNNNNESIPDSRTQSDALSSRTPPIPAPRRIYTREDVMHENTVSKGDTRKDSSSGSRRRTSKLKYFESDQPAHHHQHQQSQQQQQQQQRSLSSNIATTTKTGHISDSLDTPIKSSVNVDFHSMHQQQPTMSAISSSGAISSRRLSSPYVLDRTGVVTASLKIPVQMQAVGSNSSSGAAVGSGNARDNDDNKVFYRGSGQFDLSNIPYIEDSSYGNELGNCSEGFPITGSLSFGGGNSGGGSGGGGGGGGGGVGCNTSGSGSGEGLNVRKMSTQIIGNPSNATQATVYQIPITYEGQQIVSPTVGVKESTTEQTSKLASFLSSVNATALPSSTILTSVARDKPTRKNVPSTTFSSSQHKLTTTTQTLHMHSTHMHAGTGTAASQNEPKLPTSISNIGGAILRSKTADFERMSKVMPSANRQTRQSSGTITDVGTPSRGPLYKRQELISSAKRTSK